MRRPGRVVNTRTRSTRGLTVTVTVDGVYVDVDRVANANSDTVTVLDWTVDVLGTRRPLTVRVEMATHTYSLRVSPNRTVEITCCKATAQTMDLAL